MATSRQSERLIEAGGEDARDARVVSARMGETVGGVLYCAMPECRTWRPLAEFHGVRREASPGRDRRPPPRLPPIPRAPHVSAVSCGFMYVIKCNGKSGKASRCARTGGGATPG